MKTTERIISRKEFRELIGISRTTEWRMSLKGILPTSVIVEGVVLEYTENSYLKWIKKNSSK